MSDPKLLYLRSPIIYEILPPGGYIIIIVNCILACITTVYNIFNDMRWNLFLFFVKYHFAINSSLFYVEIALVCIFVYV